MAKLESPREGQSIGLVPVEMLTNQSIDEMDVDWILETIVKPEVWMTPIKDYLLAGTLPTIRNQQTKLLRKPPRFMIQDGILY